MKKVKIIKIVSILLFLVLVIGLPVVCSFIPYQEPYIIDETFEVGLVNDSQAAVYGELGNPTIVTIHELELHISFYDANGQFISTRTVTIEQDFNAFSTSDFMQGFTINSSEASAARWECTDIYYTYTKLGWYVYVLIGIVVYFIYTLFLMKQKYYFEIDGRKFEVYVSGYKVAIVIDGEIVSEQSVRATYNSTVTYQFGEKNLVIRYRRAQISPCPKVEIQFDGQDVEITNVKQHSFLKVIDKKKNENNFPA